MKNLKPNAFVIASFILMVNALSLVLYTFESTLNDSEQEENEEVSLELKN